MVFYSTGRLGLERRLSPEPWRLRLGVVGGASVCNIVCRVMCSPLTCIFLAFFMRKGADALSKWVGEAERQLRLLFEEARACQPSIIFFDEIDGLAPVRSSKQDQIHASIVSTLLALMDGMDGRGILLLRGHNRGR